MLQVYDFEVYLRRWFVTIYNSNEGKYYQFTNNNEGLKEYFKKYSQDLWCGFNSRAYDQFILKGILLGYNNEKLKELNDYIFNGYKVYSFDKRLYSNQVKVYGYDIKFNKMHSLKQLEGFMGHSIEETSVPFSYEGDFTEEQIKDVFKYNKHDVHEAREVLKHNYDEFKSYSQLITTFNLPKEYFNKTKPQISAVILGAVKNPMLSVDEFDIKIADNIILGRYENVRNYFLFNKDYANKHKLEIAGIPHIIGYGGIHGAIPNYNEEGLFVHIDVSRFYSFIMKNYNLLSRAVSNPKNFNKILDNSIELKKNNDPKADIYKLVCNCTFGASKDKYNDLYDPCRANNICVNGQCFLIDLMDKIEDYCKIIQSNTDGIFIKITTHPKEFIIDICNEWCERTGFSLDYKEYVKFIQKDVNNYIVIDKNGKHKGKGAYTKKLKVLDNDLPIVNKAVTDYFVHNIPVEETVNSCDDLMQFQKICKLNKNAVSFYYGEEYLHNKVVRVFASTPEQGGLKINYFKFKDGNPAYDKVLNAPEHCFIDNGDVTQKKISNNLNKQWYIDMAHKRINQYLGSKEEVLEDE